MRRTTLITGGPGYIGMLVAEGLLAVSHDVRVLDSLLHGQRGCVDAAMALIEDAADAGVERFVFASTCSNYGRMADPLFPIAEDGVPAPPSLYAEQKVAVEQALLGLDPAPCAATCLVPEGIREIVGALEEEWFEDVFDGRYRNVA